MGTSDRTAFRELYQRVGPRLKGYVIRMCRDGSRAEEITQEVLLTVWRRASSYDPKRAKAETWIFTIARNRTIDLLRHRKHVLADRRDPHFVPETPEDIETALGNAQQADRIRATMGKLPDKQRDVLERAFFASQSYSEIATSLDVPLGTVKSRARLAFKRLRELLADEVHA